MGTRRRLIAFFAVGAGLCAAAAFGCDAGVARVPGAARTAGTAGSGGAPAARGELIYVANADGGPVTAYLAASAGAVTPARAVLAAADSNANWQPWGVAFDRSGNLYVQTFLSDATAFVFRPGARGTTPALRKFVGNSPDNRSIAVDSAGYEYVAGGEQPTVIVVEPPAAAGGPGDLYYVPPVRTIQLDEQWNPWPSDLAAGADNELVAVTSRPEGNAIEIFSGGAHGGSAPVRVISGPRTGLGSCGSACDLAVAFSPLTGSIYAAVTDGARTRISVFAGGASGDARPVATIGGPGTGLAGTAITGIAVSQCDGTIYVMAHTASADFTPARVYAYGSLADGNAIPLRYFTDRRSRFTDSQGLAITGCRSR